MLLIFIFYVHFYWLCGLDKVLHLSEPPSIPYRIGMIRAPNPAGGEEDFKRQKYKTAP